MSDVSPRDEAVGNLVTRIVERIKAELDKAIYPERPIDSFADFANEANLGVALREFATAFLERPEV